MAPGHICAVKNCSNKRGKTDAIFFCFPKEPQRARVWAIAAGREDLLEKINSLCISHRICEMHFENSCFTSKEYNRLLPCATPTIFPALEGPSTDHTYSDCTRLQGSSVYVSKNSKMTTTSIADVVLKKQCKFCVACPNNSRENSELSFFRIPKDNARCCIWKAILKVKKLNEFTAEECYSRFRLCSKHFSSNMFANLKKDRLKKGAIPTSPIKGIHPTGQVGVRRQTSVRHLADDFTEESKPPAKITVLENNSATPDMQTIISSTSFSKKPTSVGCETLVFEELYSNLSGENEPATNGLRSPSPIVENSQPTHILECSPSSRLVQTSTSLLSDAPSRIEILERNLKLLRDKNSQLEQQLKDYECRLQNTKEQVMKDMTLDDYMTLTYKFCGNNIELAYFINVQVSEMEEG